MKRSRIHQAFLILVFWGFHAFSFAQSGLEGKPKAGAAEHFDYTIRPYSLEDRVNLDITANFNGSADGETDILLPLDRYGTRDIYTAVASFQVKNGTPTTVYEKPYLRKIYHEPNANLEINYTLSIDPELAATSSFGPVVEPEIFHFFWPQWTLRLLDDSLKFNYTITFDKLPDSWVAVTNLPKGPDGRYELEAIQGDFGPLIAGGNYDYYTIEIEDNPVDVAISYHFREEGLLESLRALLTFQRRFFRFKSNEQYLVSVTKREGMLGGTAINDAFVALIREGADQADVLKLLAHETFHNWVPLMADIYVDPNELGSEFKSEFFNEGFADYLPKVILFEEDLISKTEVIDLLNSTLLSYSKSPVNQISYSGMQDVLTNDEYNYLYEKIAYYRGDLIAFKWDNIIRATTKNEKNILHFVRDVIEKALESDGKIQFDDFFSIASSKYGINAKEDWQRHIIGGKKIELKDLGWLSEGHQLRSITETFYEAGFKVNQSKREGAIDGVAKGSSAYDAGLRNGMKLQRLILSKDAAKQMQLTVENQSGKTLVVAYYPARKVTYQKIEQR